MDMGKGSGVDARRPVANGGRRASGDWVVPLSSPLIRDEDLREVIEAYRSGWVAMGPRTAELEDDFREYAGAREAVAVSSCTAALHLACLAVGLGPGDSAIVPSLTFAATANAIAHTGASPRFADIRGLAHPWLSVEAVADALEPSTKAIVSVAYGGHLGETEALAELADSRGIALIEDAAHASGSWTGGRHAGTLGLAGALSFSASKNLGIGEGGMLLTGSREVAERARILRFHGVSASLWERHRAAASSYEIVEAGFNYRIDDPRAALVRARLRRLDADNARRAELDAAYREAFAGESGLAPTAPPPEGERASHCLFTVVLDSGIDRDAFRLSLAERGVQTSMHFPPLHLSPAYSGGRPNLPLTEEYGRRAVTLPMFPHMEERQQELVIDATRKALASQRASIVG